MEHQTTSSPRPLLIFKHNPKAGGGSILEVLEQLKPNKLRHNDLDRQHNPHTKGIDTDESFVRMVEFDRVSLRDKSRGFVISSIREPCDHYLSLWAFGSEGKGDAYAKSIHTDRSWSVLAYGKDPPAFDSHRDIASFQKHWLRHSSVRGLIAKRFLQSFAFEFSSSSKHKPTTNPPEAVDCWVFVDDFQASLVSCLQQFEDQGGSVNWNAPLLADMVQELQDKEHGRKTMDYTKDDPLNNLQLTHHSKCSTYFDKATAQLIQEGEESFIYDMFGYTGCCQTTRAKTSLSQSQIDQGEYGKTSAGNMATHIQQFHNRSGPSARGRGLAGAITGAGLVIVSLVLRRVIKGIYNSRRRLYQRTRENDADDIEHNEDFSVIKNTSEIACVPKL